MSAPDDARGPRATDFSAFFTALWGHAPWPWQDRLAQQVIAEGRWPTLLDLPTGAGKTAAIDVALFALAVDPARHARRIVLVVDRRTLVSQAAARMRTISAALEAPTDPVLVAVAHALRALGGPAAADGPVVECAQLRGGAPLEADWARSPATPALIASTVDQVGSRLLFSGYGLSDSMAALHAGLLGHDCLYLLDEVHLAGPFARTLADVDRLRAAEALPPRPWSFCALSATPGEGTSGRPFQLDAADEAHPLLARRLSARKQLRLHEAPPTTAPGAKGDEAWVKHLCARARALAVDGRVVGLIVNRVDTAHACAATLAAGANPPALLLVTGRMRPLDREEVDARLMARAGGERRPAAADAQATVLVATQCVEAGVDLDLDALVTECPSLDALQQRAGRLNRRGLLDAAPLEVWLRPGYDKPDPIYGGAIAETAALLRALGEQIEGGEVLLDLDPRAIGRLLLQRAATGAPALPLGPSLAPRPASPRLLPAHVDALCQTGPRPAAAPTPAHFLHGFEAGPPEVSLCWRAELDGIALDAAHASPALLDALGAALGALPPSAGELLRVPLHTARAFFRGGAAPLPQGADLLSAPPDDDDDKAAKAAPTAPRAALRWRGPDTQVELVVGADKDALRPGDLLVLPTTAGGLTLGCFDGAGADPVPDRAEDAWLASQGQRRARLLPALLAGRGLPPCPITSAEGDDEALSPRERVAAWIDGLDEGARGALGPLLARGRALVVPAGASGADPYVVLIGPNGAATTEAEAGSFGLPTARPAALRAHLDGVGARAEAFAAALGLPDDLVRLLAEAGRAHDLGKVDPRFQLMLFGGDKVAMRRAARGASDGWAGLLAKSGHRSAAERQRAARAAAAPAGLRHELQSVRLLEQRMPEVTDPELLLHLVASHHGHCRPLAPVCLDPGVPLRLPATASAPPVEARSGPEGAVDDAHPQRFWSTLRRYGPWGQAWLEAILRLADHRQSEHEARTAKERA
ncbi:MAG: hypothetical protein RL071_3371 [Pseudomonadota bacterium]